jgi:hypothetical protein
MLSRGCPVTSAILTTSKTDEKSEVLSEFFTKRLGNDITGKVKPQPFSNLPPQLQKGRVLAP